MLHILLKKIADERAYGNCPTIIKVINSMLDYFYNPDFPERHKGHIKSLNIEDHKNNDNGGKL